MTLLVGTRRLCRKQRGSGRDRAPCRVPGLAGDTPVGSHCSLSWKLFLKSQNSFYPSTLSAFITYKCVPARARMRTGIQFETIDHNFSESTWNTLEIHVINTKHFFKSWSLIQANQKAKKKKLLQGVLHLEIAEVAFKIWL